jgi:DNA-binding CsgD family transcriptional regulator
VANSILAMIALGQNDYDRSADLISASFEQSLGDLDRAARLFGAATALRESIGSPLKEPYVPVHEQTVAALRKALGDNDFGSAWEEGRAMTADQVVAYVQEAPSVPTAPVREPKPATPFGLSNREMEVLKLFATGMSDREIADTLEPKVSHRTVTTHAQSIYAKLGVNTRTEAVAVAMRHGLI